MSADIYFVYDGECPICQMGARMYTLRQNVGTLHTVDARTEKDHPVMLEINAAGLNVDDGMVIQYEDKLYQGRDALVLMAELGADTGCLNRLNNRLFKCKALATVSYPLMKTARRIALCCKGKDLIRNLEK